MKKLSDEEIEKLINDWKTDVADKASRIDPENEYVWTGLCIAYFIGKGLSLKQAISLEDQCSYRWLV